MSTRRLLLILAFGAGVPGGPAAAQTSGIESILARGDSAFNAGDTAVARTAYTRALSLDAYRSRAVYQLARLEPPGSREQIRLFQRYTELEPGDAWGFAALGDAHRDAGDIDEARAAYREGLGIAPDAADIREALEALPRPARGRSFSVEPQVGGAGDSDGTRTTRLGASATVAIGAGGAFGLGGARITLEDDIGRVEGWTATVDARARPLRPLHLAGQAGLLSAHDAATGTTIVEPVAQARIRWRPEQGFAVELRARHGPITATPGLLAGPVVLSEARGTAELPVVGGLYVRAVGRLGALRSPGVTDPGTGGPGMGRPGTGGGAMAQPAVTNTRAMVGAGPVFRLLPGLEVSALAGRSGYADSAAASYFAPDRVDLVDAGVYWEHERGPFVIALDAGGGLERVQPFNAPSGDWGRALRLWSQVAWTLGPAAALRLELEGYDTRGGDAVVMTAGGWRWWSIGAALVLRR